ncbi:hypothetical protein KC360_g86 [Hortaea werneckii]|nr:hypothetical protein KC360_g86 [Hortaea werneckii]
MELQALGFVVEVEVNVVQVVIPTLLVRRLNDIEALVGLLVAFLRICSVLQRIDLRPVDRHTASRLHIGKYLSFPTPNRLSVLETLVASKGRKSTGGAIPRDMYRVPALCRDRRVMRTKVNVRVNFRLHSASGPSSALAFPEIDEGRRNKTIPEKSVVCPLPQWFLLITLGLALETVGQIEGVGEEHWAGLDLHLQVVQIHFLVWVGDLAFPQWHELSGYDLVDLMALYATHLLRLGDHNHIADARNARHSMAASELSIIQSKVSSWTLDDQ